MAIALCQEKHHFLDVVIFTLHLPSISFPYVPLSIYFPLDTLHFYFAFTFHFQGHWASLHHWHPARSLSIAWQKPSIGCGRPWMSWRCRRRASSAAADRAGRGTSQEETGLWMLNGLRDDNEFIWIYIVVDECWWWVNDGDNYVYIIVVNGEWCCCQWRFCWINNHWDFTHG
jgi:hypothetical protein